jgi:hypothetical protein
MSLRVTVEYYPDDPDRHYRYVAEACVEWEALKLISEVQHWERPDLDGICPQVHVESTTRPVTDEMPVIHTPSGYITAADWRDFCRV